MIWIEQIDGIDKTSYKFVHSVWVYDTFDGIYLINLIDGID